MKTCKDCLHYDICDKQRIVNHERANSVCKRFKSTADVVEVEKVAEMLRIMFDDDCACNYNNNDEWLPLVCECEDECPTPKARLACWKQFVKHFLKKMDGERKEQT